MKIAGRCILMLAVIVLFGSPLQAQRVESRALVKQLADVEKRADAVEKIVKMGREAVVPLLYLIEDRDADLEARGWAIICLTKIGDVRSVGTLKDVMQNTSEKPLVRLWATAAMADLVPEVALESMLRMSYTDQNTKFRDAVSKTILDMGANAASPLLKIVFNGSDQTIRWYATSFLGNPKLNTEEMREGYIEKIRYSGNLAKSGEPWRGGPLYVPSITWSKEEAREMLSHFIHWMLWTDQSPNNNRAAAFNQIRNNIVSLAQRTAVMNGRNLWNMDSLAWTFAWVDSFAITNGEAVGDADIENQAVRLLVHALDAKNGAGKAGIRNRLRIILGTGIDNLK